VEIGSGICPHILSASGRGPGGINPRGIAGKEVGSGFRGRGARWKMTDSHSVVGSGVCALVDAVVAVMTDRARFVDIE
jgi:hypothetical protein